MQLGWFTHVAGTGSPRSTYRDTIAPAVAAEQRAVMGMLVDEVMALVPAASLPAVPEPAR